MFAIEVSESQLSAEVEAMRDWRKAGYSVEYITERAGDVVRARMIREAEQAALAHIDSLTEQQTREELTAYDAKHSSARSRFAEVEKTLTKKLNDFQKEQTGNVHRDSGRYSASNITQLDEEKRALRAELTECAWWRERLGSRASYFDRLARQPQVDKAKQKTESDIRPLFEMLSNLSPEALDLLASSEMYDGMDYLVRQFLQSATQSLIQASRYIAQQRTTKEAQHEPR